MNEAKAREEPTVAQIETDNDMSKHEQIITKRDNANAMQAKPTH